jgi:putative ABC transport system substrate-binding protein
VAGLPFLALALARVLIVERFDTFAHQVLKGENAGDLPIQAPTKYQLILNLKTAKALDLTISPSLLARADEVIE